LQDLAVSSGALLADGSEALLLAASEIELG
jgi:hypothetical protein